ncbi:hypothetical protein SFC08_10625 [Lysinibacillus halotolerans]|uniref:Uncharacterized protein n=1 Tax=Lysinibacillus halotolerans TaxID=1368476 RepID=A0A3M8HAW0_9BACI|nr:hypothetical protein [Lysinibacillus halotolerans]RNC99541.1 hypothetical protein EC501_07275 [Lysinibacillus halotolerans]
MKIILFVIILVIILNKAHGFIYIKGLKNNWIKYLLFSFIASVILTGLQFYVFDHWGNIKENMVSALIMSICHFAIFILYPIVRDKVNALSE